MISDEQLEDLLSMQWNGKQVPQRWFSRSEVVALLKKATSGPEPKEKENEQTLHL